MPALGHFTVEPSRVEDGRQFRSTVLAVGAEVLVQVVQAFELQVLGHRLVEVARLVSDAHHRPGLSRLLQKRQKVRGQDNVAEMIQSHVSIDAVVSELVRHDAPASIVDEDIQAVRRVLDLVGDFADFLPVTEVAVLPDGLVSRSLAEVLGYGLLGALDHILGHRKDEELADVVLEQRVGDSVSNTFTSPRDYRHLARLVGRLLQTELVRGELWSNTAEVFSKSVLSSLCQFCTKKEKKKKKKREKKRKLCKSLDMWYLPWLGPKGMTL